MEGLNLDVIGGRRWGSTKNTYLTPIQIENTKGVHVCYLSRDTYISY